jgi:hypothetical protein
MGYGIRDKGIQAGFWDNGIRDTGYWASCIPCPGRTPGEVVRRRRPLLPCSTAPGQWPITHRPITHHPYELVIRSHEPSDQRAEAAVRRRRPLGQWREVAMRRRRAERGRVRGCAEGARRVSVGVETGGAEGARCALGSMCAPKAPHMY